MSTKTPDGKTPNHQFEFNTHLFFNVNRDLKPANSGFSDIRTCDQLRNQVVIESAFADCKEWNYITDYQKRFYIVRSNQSPEALRNTVSFRGYRDFIADISKNVYQHIYGFDKLHQATSTDEIEMALKKHAPEMNQDFFCEHSIVAAISLSEIIEKLIEGDMLNMFSLFNTSYTHHLNLKLSPIVLGISFYNYKVLKMKSSDTKSSDGTKSNDGTKSSDSTKPKSSLAKITYIHFIGYFSEIDLDILYHTSENIQVIMIYDRASGGPSFDKNDPLNDFDPVDARLAKEKKSMLKLSQNILLLPLDCTNGVIDSSEIYNLFESVVYRAILNFKPELIVLNHAFNFHPSTIPEESFPFSLKVSTFQKILYDLCILCSYKLMIIPHKLIGKDEYQFKTDFNTSNSHVEEFMKGTLRTYSRPWNVKYFTDCYVGALEVLTGMKSFERPRKKSHRLLPTINTKYLAHLIKVLNCYKTHPLYNQVAIESFRTVTEANRSLQLLQAKSILQSKNPVLKGKLSDLEKNFDFNNKSQEKKIKETLLEFESNTIVLLIPERIRNESSMSAEIIREAVVEFELYFEKDVPAYPLRKSQHIFDQKNMTLYYFNLWYQGKFTHFQFKIPSTRSKGRVELIGSQLPDHPLQAAQGSKTLFEVGLCTGGNKIFWIYGESSAQPPITADSDRIFYYNIDNKEWVEPKVTGSDPKIKNTIRGRYGVTCNYFKSESGDRIYVFGGNSNEYVLAGKLKLYNVVELFILDFKSNEFNYHFFDKQTLSKHSVSYMPFFHSQSIQFNKKILIFGGEHFNNSSNEIEDNKIFVFNSEKFGFTPVGKNPVKTFGEKEFSKKNFKVTTQIISSSQNIIEKNGFHYVLSSLGKNCYSIAQVSVKEGENNDTPTINIYPYVVKDNKTQPFEHYTKMDYRSNDNYVIDRDLPQMINVFDNESPETYFMFNTLVTALKNYYQKEKSLDMSAFTKFLGKIIDDPMLKIRQEANLPVIRGVIELFQIFNSRDNQLRQKVDTLCKEISYNPIHRSDANKSWYAKVTKLALSTNVNEKRQFIDIAEALLKKYLATEKRLKIETALRIDRIFQRNLMLKDYHNPLFDEISHRWFTEDISNLVALDLKAIEIYVKEADLGILRDLCVTFTKLFEWVTTKEQSSGGPQFSQDSMIPVDEFEQGSSNFWKDTERDKLSSLKESKNESSQNLVISSAVVSQENNQEKIKEILVKFLAEIGRREKIDPQKITSRQINYIVESSIEKWFELSDLRPDVWRSVAHALGYEVPADFKPENSRKEALKVVDKQPPPKKDLPKEEEASSSHPNKKQQKNQYPTTIRGNPHDTSSFAEDESTKDTRYVTEFDESNATHNEIVQVEKVHNESSQALKVHNESSQAQKDASSQKQKDNSKLKIPDSNEDNQKDEKNRTKPEAITRKIVTQTSELQPQKTAFKLMLEAKSVIRSLKKRISYHSVNNLQESHSETGEYLKGAQFCLTSSGAELCCQIQSKVLRCKLFIYEAQKNTLFPIYVEKDQMKSLYIWNAAAYLFLDRSMADKFFPADISKKLANCLLYSDLRQAFDENGETKGQVTFVPVLKNTDDLVNRAVTADNTGIFIIGGMMTRKNPRNPIISAGYCNYYEVSNLEELGTEEVEGPMDTMEIKRHDPIVAQTETRLFVADRTNESSVDKTKLQIEVFDKEDFSWIYAFELETNREITSYSLSQISKGEGEEDLLIVIGHKFGKYSTGYIIDVNLLDNRPKENYLMKDGIKLITNKIDKLTLKDQSTTLAYTGFENLQILNNYSDKDTLLIGDFKRDTFETISFKLW